MGTLGRQLRFVFLGTVLVVAAFSTGINFLFFLVYLLAALLVGSWFYARQGLRGVKAGYHVLNPRAQVGEVLEAVYRVDNQTRWTKPWVELWNESNLPASLPNLFTGLRLGFSQAWLFVVVAEIFGAAQGLGFVELAFFPRAGAAHHCPPFIFAPLSATAFSEPLPAPCVQ